MSQTLGKRQRPESGAELGQEVVIDLKLNKETRLYELLDDEQQIAQIQKSSANPTKRAKIVRDGNTVILPPNTEGSEASSVPKNKLADHPTIVRQADGDHNGEEDQP